MPKLSTVVMSGRILERHVGGNTTYARAIAAGLREHGITVEPMPYARQAAMTAARESLAARRHRTPGTVLHFAADTGPLVGCASPAVVTVHGVASRWISVARRPAQEAIWRARVRAAVTECDHVITVSDTSAADILATFDVSPKRLTVIPHGVDARRFATPAAQGALPPGLPEEFALYLGNIEPRKNLIELVRAWEGPDMRGRDVPLVVAGKPAWNAQPSLEAIDASPHVISLGFVSDEAAVALLQRCALFVFPSLYEGFGFPVLEAMAAGAPVVCSDRGSLRDVAGPARILPGLGAEAIGAAIGAALDDDAWRAVVPAAGREWAKGFTWSRSVSAHLDVYRGVLR